MMLLTSWESSLSQLSLDADAAADTEWLFDFTTTLNSPKMPSTVKQRITILAACGVFNCTWGRRPWFDDDDNDERKEEASSSTSMDTNAAVVIPEWQQLHLYPH